MSFYFDDLQCAPVNLSYFYAFGMICNPLTNSVVTYLLLAVMIAVSAILGTAKLKSSSRFLIFLVIWLLPPTSFRLLFTPLPFMGAGPIFSLVGPLLPSNRLTNFTLFLRFAPLMECSVTGYTPVPNLSGGGTGTILYCGLTSFYFDDGCACQLKLFFWFSLGVLGLPSRRSSLAFLVLLLTILFTAIYRGNEE